MNMSSLYFLFNLFRNIECGWLFQLNGDVTYAINRTGVASLTLGVNSLRHVNNPICWAIIPEKTGGKTTYRDTWRTAQEAAILAVNTYMLFVGVGATHAKWVNGLRDSARIQTLMNKKSFKDGRFEVDATLCDQLANYHNFTEEEFGFEANTCDNRFLGIRASQRRNTLIANILHRRRTMTSITTTWCVCRKSESR
jgi:hypothetical protein